jgi:transcriptional regulator with XRE-family HTH domain
MENESTVRVILGTFGKRLKVARAERGMSQIELSNAMKHQCGVRVGGSYISELEGSSTKTPTLRVAAAMAEVLDVSLDYFGLLIHEPLSYKRYPVTDPDALTDAVTNFLLENFSKKSFTQEDHRQPA